EAQVVEGYINRIAPKGANWRFSLVYYEIRATGDLQGTPHSISKIDHDLPFSSKNWDDRVLLHRAIVEHTSTNRSFPAPALFLENDFIPRLPRPKSVPDTNGDDSERLYEESPLSAVFRWIVQSRMLTDEIGFESILIDVGPWFDSYQGRSALFQEGIACR